MWIRKKTFEFTFKLLESYKACYESGERVIKAQDEQIKSLKNYVKLADILMKTNKKVDNNETIEKTNQRTTCTGCHLNNV